MSAIAAIDILLGIVCLVYLSFVARPAVLIFRDADLFAPHRGTHRRIKRAGFVRRGIAGVAMAFILTSSRWA
jgi:hypothetical protein